MVKDIIYGHNMDSSSNKIIIFIDNYKFDVTEYAHTHPG